MVCLYEIIIVVLSIFTYSTTLQLLFQNKKKRERKRGREKKPKICKCTKHHYIEMTNRFEEIKLNKFKNAL